MGTVVDNQTRLAGLLPMRDPNGLVDEVVAALPARDNDGDGGDGGGTGGGVGKVLLDIAKAVPDFVTQCMPNITATQPSFSVGLGLCFDEACARKLAAILLAGGAPPLAAAGAAAVGAGSVAAAVTAAVAAAGGWVTLIVVICVVIFSGWFSSCITSDGACIHFPWWAGFGPIPFARRL